MWTAGRSSGHAAGPADTGTKRNRVPPGGFPGGISILSERCISFSDKAPLRASAARFWRTVRRPFPAACFFRMHATKRQLNPLAACRRQTFAAGFLGRQRHSSRGLPGRTAIFFQKIDDKICVNCQNIFWGLDKNASPGLHCGQSKANKPMMRTSTQSEALSESRQRWDGGREESVEWTAEGGPNREFLPPVSADGLFPRYQGKACVCTPRRGRSQRIANLGGTAEVSDFCPKEL